LVLAIRYDGKEGSGGLEVVLRETTARLVESHGLDVTVLASRGSSDLPLEERRGHLRIVRYDERAFASPLLAFSARIRRILAQDPVDAVHSHFAYCSTGVAAMLPRDVPRIRTFHGSWPSEGWALEVGDGAPTVKAKIKRRLRHEVEQWDLRRSQRIVVLSTYAKELLSGTLGVDPSRIARIPGGVDLQRFHPIANKSAERARLCLPAAKRLLLFVGRLIPFKGVHVLIEAFARLRATRSDLHLAIVGSGRSEAPLRNQVQAAGLERDVTFCGHQSERLQRYYAAADVCIVPSLPGETFGLVALEALACGVPAIASGRGGTVDILRGLDERLLLDAGDSADVTRALESFLEGDWAASLSQDRLRAYVAANFTWDKHAELLAAELRKLAGGSAFVPPPAAAALPGAGLAPGIAATCAKEAVPDRT
jgi:glycosyltransferase involved in cell wall biosynthesis